MTTINFTLRPAPPSRLSQLALRALADDLRFPYQPPGPRRGIFITINGIKYSSARSASRATGIPYEEILCDARFHREKGKFKTRGDGNLVRFAEGEQ